LIISQKKTDKISNASTFNLGALISSSSNRTFNVLIRYRNLLNEEYITKGRLESGRFYFEGLEKSSGS